MLVFHDRVKSTEEVIRMLLLPAAPDLAALPARFISKIDVVQPGHWLWTAYVDPHGYGRVSWRGRVIGAHEAVWEALNGPVPDGLELDHACEFHRCVFPLCLEPVTHLENMRRMSLRQTVCRRAGHPLTPENTISHPQRPGHRWGCRACKQERERERYARNRRKVNA